MLLRGNKKRTWGHDNNTKEKSNKFTDKDTTKILT
jgi:hypothetical protein